MRVVVAHGRVGERQRFRKVLAQAGHDVTECDCADETFDRCLELEPDVAVIDDAAGHGVLERIKRHPDAFRTAVLLVEREDPPVERATAALQRGVHDNLVEPVSDAELITRVQAAGRTKGLQEEIVTISVGWATWDGEAADELLGRADQALYAAKERGRDCVVGAPATLPRRR